MAWAPDYTDLDGMHEYLGIPDTDTGDDGLLALCITAASRAVDRSTNRQFGLVGAAEERYYRAEYRPDRGVYVAVIDDLMTTTGAAVANDDADAVTDYRLEPRNAAAEGRPWTRLVVGRDSTVLPVWPDYEVAVTGRWGWTAVPTTVKLATQEQASRFFARRESPYGVAGSPDLGSEIRLLAKLDADVAVMLAAYNRTRRPR